MTRKREEGAALLTVLLLVAVMSALAVGVLDDIRFGLRRTANAETVGQAQWYALGAETLARTRLAQLAVRDPLRTPAAGDWNGRSLLYPIDNGVIRARIADAGACFNLNSVVQGASEQWGRRHLGLAQFVALLRALEISPRDAEALAETLADWIDSDGNRTTLGGEDDTYINAAPPYRTAGTLLSEVSELRAVRGFTPDLYARIRPFVCALPTADLSPINVNLLDAGNAVLLTMLTDGGLDPEAAAELIGARPDGGWLTVDEFWNNPVLTEHLPPDAALDQVSLRTRFFSLQAEVDYAGSEAVMTSLFEQQAAGPIRLVARRWTLEE
jgi:general secretion pathway protein K